jgi:hypothetical protein
MKTSKQSQQQTKGGRRQEKMIEQLMQDLDSSYRRQQFITEEGKSIHGVLLDSDECELLVSWWEEMQPRHRGRPKLHPSLFGNPYKEEFEQERQKIVAARKKERGATKQAIAVLAARHRVEFDTMRKRIYGKKIK